MNVVVSLITLFNTCTVARTGSATILNVDCVIRGDVKKRIHTDCERDN